MLPLSACDVRDYGAVGDGVHIDTAPINRALADPKCGSVHVPRGGIFLSGSLHLRSHLCLVVHGTLRGVPAGQGINYDLPERNPWSHFQDIGHSPQK